MQARNFIQCLHVLKGVSLIILIVGHIFCRELQIFGVFLDGGAVAFFGQAVFVKGVIVVVHAIPVVGFGQVFLVIVTGVLGNIFAEKFLKLLSIKEPIAKGIAIGCSAHALGTAKAMEMGTIEGAMSSLSIVVCGVMTVVGSSIFALFM